MVRGLWPSVDVEPEPGEADPGSNGIGIMEMHVPVLTTTTSAPHNSFIIVPPNNRCDNNVTSNVPQLNAGMFGERDKKQL